jgi:hypothetical protein
MLLYDTIVNQYNEYTAYNNLLEKSIEKINKKRDSILQKVIDKDEVDEEINDLIFDTLLQKKLYKNDVQLLFYNLYKSVEFYKQIEDAPELPKEVVDLCQELEFTIPKTVFIVDKENLKERVEGTVGKVKKSWVDTGEVQRIAERFKNTQG